MKYNDFLKNKIPTLGLNGFEIKLKDINKKAFSFQRDIIHWSLKKGRAAIFADCGLGKTLMQLEWAKHIQEKTKGNILILAPLSVAEQTVQEGIKFNVKLSIVRKQESIKKPGIYITNYEMLHHFTPNSFNGIVLDESSILKSFDGKTRNAIITSFGNVNYRLACTATPAPNDFMELGNHSEFLGAMTRSEMLSMFFVHDGGETSKWRIKKHAKDVFWKWVCSWAITLSKPSDLGYDDNGFILPKLKIHNHVVKGIKLNNDALFELGASTLDERRMARKGSVNQRIEKCISILDKTKEKSIIWCDYNLEQDTLAKILKSIRNSL